MPWYPLRVRVELEVHLAPRLGPRLVELERLVRLELLEREGSVRRAARPAVAVLVRMAVVVELIVGVVAVVVVVGGRGHPPLADGRVAEDAEAHRELRRVCGEREESGRELRRVWRA